MTDKTQTSRSPACLAALEDMRAAHVDTSVFGNEELIRVYAGVEGRPNYDWLKGQHQGAAFERAYKRREEEGTGTGSAEVPKVAKTARKRPKTK